MRKRLIIVSGICSFLAFCGIALSLLMKKDYLELSLAQDDELIW